MVEPTAADFVKGSVPFVNFGQVFDNEDCAIALLIRDAGHFVRLH
jgi:hypothetical protein